MRPEILFPLFADTRHLPGVGPRIAKYIETLAGSRVGDLLRLLPTSVIDRRFTPKISDAPDGATCTIDVTVMSHRPASGPNRPDVVSCSDGSGVLELVFFHRKGDILGKQLPVGEKRTVSGRVEHCNGRIQMTHPDHVVMPEVAAALRQIEPVYPLTHGLTTGRLRRVITEALASLPVLPEWNDAPLLAREGWASWHDSLMTVHAPERPEDILSSAPARQRLAYDEFLANQLALAMIRREQQEPGGRVLCTAGILAASVERSLPFRLTGSQREALAEIRGDMRTGDRMLRLLQGDVGSGKTVVAFLAMLTAIEAGAQAVLMAPTAILARQHYATIAAFAAPAGLKCALLTGDNRGRTRTSLLAELAAGAIDIAIGTHALFQDDVAFSDLGLVIIDEQHRFGVHQRLALGTKGITPDMLVMTATPIPRSLTMTAYGDLDISRLTERPPGRQPVVTRALPVTRLDDVIEAVARARCDNARTYWICPLIEESENRDITALEARYRSLCTQFGDQVGLVHGRLTEAARDAAILEFRNGTTTILAATTVIEVGLDIPEASVMVIEHAERFGLAQLHQLRGRIGRGSTASTCLLLYQPPLGTAARTRLAIMRETEDGFRIAEEDLKLRGSGELLGTRQSGLPRFRIADPAVHGDLLDIAQRDARTILARDPDLVSERGAALRILLHLFEQNAAARFLKSG